MRHSLLSLALTLALGPTAALAATCGDDASGFDRWKRDFAREAAAAGVGPRGLSALEDARYSTATIRLDRNQRSFDHGLEEFMRIRGSETIVNRGRRMLERNRGFYDRLERAYGVPAGVLIAIHGMETGFGGFMGDENVVSSIATVAYDCRRAAFFRPHAIAALRMVDRGMMSADQRGAAHGELGHTQFLPGNALRFGVDGDGDGRVDFNDLSDAMASTANFLRAHGWRPGAGFQPGEPNFRVIEAWNAAGVYQRAIALMAAEIGG